MEVSTVVDLLKQAYLENKWELILESIEMLQREEIDEEYSEKNSNELF